MTSGLDRTEVAAFTGARQLIEDRLSAGSWTLSDHDLLDQTREILALRAGVDALLLETIGEVDSRGLAKGRGCPSTRAWLRSAHRIAPHEAARLLSTAQSLRNGLPSVAASLGAGKVSLAQVEVIVTAIGDLPTKTPVACKPQAEATMIEAAATFDPVILARLGRRLAEIVDPEGVQDRDEQPIVDKEDDAHRDRTLSLTPDTDGAGGYLRARLDAVGYATLSAYLAAATVPKATPDDDDSQPDTVADADTRNLGQRRHDAAVEAVRQMLAGGNLPSSSGVKPRIVLTLPPTASPGGRVPAGSPTGPRSARHWPGSCPATPTSSPSPSTPPATPSTSAGPGGCSPAPSAPPWKSATAAVHGRAVIAPSPGPRLITSCPGGTEVRPDWKTVCCCACSTITRSRKATGRSPSDEDEPGSPRQPGSTGRGDPEATRCTIHLLANESQPST